MRISATFRPFDFLAGACALSVNGVRVRRWKSLPVLRMYPCTEPFTEPCTGWPCTAAPFPSRLSSLSGGLCG